MEPEPEIPALPPDAPVTIEIGAFGKVHHDLWRAEFVDVWEDQGTLMQRAIPVPRFGSFSIASCGHTVYAVLANGDGTITAYWFGYEYTRREDNGEPTSYDLNIPSSPDGRNPVL